VRAAYVVLGDKLGWRGIVATKLVEWWLEAKPGPERLSNLRGAFDRFNDVGRNEDAVRIGCEIVRSKGADGALAKELERLANREIAGVRYDDPKTVGLGENSHDILYALVVLDDQDDVHRASHDAASAIGAASAMVFTGR